MDYIGVYFLEWILNWFKVFSKHTDWSSPIYNHADHEGRCVGISLDDIFVQFCCILKISSYGTFKMSNEGAWKKTYPIWKAIHWMRWIQPRYNPCAEGLAVCVVLLTCNMLLNDSWGICCPQLRSSQEQSQPRFHRFIIVHCSFISVWNEWWDRSEVVAETRRRVGILA